MSGNKITTPRPLGDSLVDYRYGSPKTVPQYAKDAAASPMWAAEPKLDERKRLGFSVLIFLIVYAGPLFATKKTIWARAPGRMLNLIRHRLASLQNQRV